MSPLLLRLLGIAAMVGGVALLALAFLTGGAHFALVLIIPVIYGSSGYLAGGILLFFLGIFVLFWAAAESVSEDPAAPLPYSSSPPGSPGTASSRTSYGGFLLIGPVPVVFGNRPGWLPYLIALGFLTVIAFLLFFVLF